MNRDVQDAMHNAGLYACNDTELFKSQNRRMEILYDFNHCRPSEGVRRNKLLRQLLADVGDNCHIEPPLNVSWGCHTHLGKNVYANFNLTLVDDTHIHIGDFVMFGPNVTLATASHPVAPEFRNRESPLQFNIPIIIENNVWIGAGVVVVPGITIGENSVIGAGSVVTKNIPANVVAVGSPCQVIREIDDRDREYYHKDRQIDRSHNY